MMNLNQFFNTSILGLLLTFHSYQMTSAFSPTTTPTTTPNNKKNSYPSKSQHSAVSLLEYEVNTDELYSSSTFPIKPNDLITRAKEVLSSQISLGTKDNGQCLAPNFTFRAAFVEVNREGYLNALGSFKLEDGFDIQPNYFGFVVDPMQTNRVWFYGRSVARHVGNFAGVEATQKELILPPQSFHLDFDENGLITEVGFYTVDRAQGNTGGLGGAFAYFYGVGKPLPFPEAKPWKPSFRYKMLTKFGNLLEKLRKKN